MHAIHNAQQLWLRWSRGEIDDATAQAAAEAAHRPLHGGKGRRGAVGHQTAPTTTAGRQRRYPVSPDRARSTERRRHNAASGWLPPQLAASLTVGEQAVLAVVARQIAERGRCDLAIAQIAPLAGVAARSAQRALRLAERMGLIKITERPLAPLRNDTNLIEILDARWRAWIKHRVTNRPAHAVPRFSGEQRFATSMPPATASNGRGRSLPLLRER